MLRRSSEGIPLLIAVDGDSAEPLFRQICRSIRDAILTGRLAAGHRLPATRVLAADLGVSRNTVLTAYDQLLSEGYLEARVGRGTRVSAAIPDALLRAQPWRRRAEVPAAPIPLGRRGEMMLRVAQSRSLLREPDPPFRPGVPALDRFPWQIWRRLASARLRRMEADDANYAEPLGYEPLRAAIARYLGAARGIACGPEQVLIVAGSQQGLDLAARVCLDPGDRVWLEDPGYYGAFGAFAGGGAAVEPVPVDGEGLDVGAARARCPGARLAYVTPSHQFPLGVTMSLPRRLELLEWASGAGAWILEDDYDSEFRYVGPPLTALRGLDTADRVIYCGTFSKVLFPALRVGYLVAPRGLAPALGAARSLVDVQPPTFEQTVLTEFIAGGHLERHVRRMRALYLRRQLTLLGCGERELRGLLELRPADSGMHVVGWLPDGVSDREVARRAAALKVDAIPISAFALEPYPRPGIVLGYAHVDEADIREACRRLAVAIRESREKGGGRGEEGGENGSWR